MDFITLPIETRKEYLLSLLNSYFKKLGSKSSSKRKSFDIPKSKSKYNSKPYSI
jgi:hypothetical protein